MTTRNLCMSCGACCAAFRVSFPADEVEPDKEGGVPESYTVMINGVRRAMKGTEGKNKRCLGLNGIIGESVSCAIYDCRPSPCRGFLAAWEENTINSVCDRARALCGLPPFDIY